jgi:hypothetical protein
MESLPKTIRSLPDGGLHGLDPAWNQVAEHARVPPRRVLQAPGDQLGHPVQRDRDCSVLRRSSSRSVRVWNRARLVDGGIPPRSLEWLVRPAPEPHRVEARDARGRGPGLLLVRHDPVEGSVGPGNVSVRGRPADIAIRRDATASSAVPPLALGSPDGHPVVTTSEWRCRPTVRCPPVVETGRSRCRSPRPTARWA